MNNPNKIKTILLSILFILILSLIPNLVGFLIGYFLNRHSLYETIVALFALIYLFLFLIRLSKKDKNMYRSKKYASKADYKQSDEYQRYKIIQFVFIVSVLFLVISSIFIFFFFVKSN